MTWSFWLAICAGFLIGIVFGAALYAHGRQCIEDIRAERMDWWGR